MNAQLMRRRYEALTPEQQREMNDGICLGKTDHRLENLWRRFHDQEQALLAGRPVAERPDIFPAQPPTLQLV